jgi:DUF4097 and DUF4098 domain-containing protein YvlB
MKALKIAQLVIWGVIAAVLIGLLVYFVSSGAGFGSFSWGSDYSTELYNNTFTATDISQIESHTSSANITFSVSDNDEIKVVCMGSKKEKENGYVQVSNEGGVLNIKQNYSFPNFFFFNFGNSVRFEISLPKDYDKNLTMSNTSGDISFNDDFTFANVDLSQTSGHLQGNTITCDSFKENTTSGDMDFGSIVTKSYRISGTSGNISVDNLSGSGSLKSTSGNITAGLATLTDSLDGSVVSGNIDITLAKDISAHISANCVSGNINSNFALNHSGRSSANGDVGSGPYNNISLSTVSGNVDINQ